MIGRVGWPTIRYAALNAAYWSGFCLTLAFSSAFLLARGLTNSEIGVVIAVSGAISAVLQPPVAGWAGRSRQPLRVWIAWLAVVIAAAAAILLVPGAHPARDGVVFGVALCVAQLVVPLVNAVGMECVARGIPVEFGPARAVGSFAFALTSIVTGSLVAASGPQLIPMLLIGAEALLVVPAVTFVFRSSASVALPGETPSLPDAPPLDARGRRLFGVLLAGMVALYVSHAAINTFVFQIVRYHGGTASDMGLAFTIAATIETLPMLFFRRIVARWTPAALLRFAAVMFAVKAAAAWWATNLTAFLATQLLQVFAFALVIPASVYYIDRLLPLRERVRGQAFMTLTLTLGNVIAGLIGGILLDAAGVPALLAGGTIVCALGAVAVWWGTGNSLSRHQIAPAAAV